MEWMTITFLWTSFSFFFQARDYTFYDDFNKASIFISLLVFFILVCLVAVVCYRVISFFTEYPKLSENLKKATDLILQEGEYQKLNASNIFLF